MNVTVLVNPAARSGAHTPAAHQAVEQLRDRGAHPTVVTGTTAEESTALIRDALRHGADALVVVGGDGTVSLALQELAHTDVPLGIIPSGTGNDIAVALGIPTHDARAAADIVAAGPTRLLDLARVALPGGGARYFASVLASGFDSRVNDRANRMRWPRGSSRYTLAILREVIGLRGVPYEVELVGENGERTTLRRDLLMATVANSTSYGGGIPICPPADPGDGILDVVLVRPAGRLRFLGLLPRVYRGTHGTVPEVSMHRVRQVTLRAEATTAYADGDPVAALPLTIDAAPAAVRVFAPPPPQA